MWTVEEFRTTYPAFADSAKYSDAEIQNHHDIALEVIGDDGTKLSGIMCDLYTAHSLALSHAANTGGGVVAGSGTSSVSSKSVGSVSVSYENTTSQVLSGSTSWFALTLWGKQLLELRKMKPAALQL